MKSAFFAAAFALVSSPALAVGTSEKMIEFARAQFSNWGQSATIIDAVNSQNTRTVEFNNSDIDALDQAWRAEVGTSNRPMVDEILSNALSQFLAEQVKNSGGVITEVFVMDARGLNVGQSAPTSDYWQGDEAKYSETYSVGPNAVHASEIELDESTQAYQGQVSLSVVDPSNGEVIGAITFGLDAQTFF